MVMADATEIVFDAYDGDGRILKASLIVSGHHEDAGAVKLSREVVEESDVLDEFIVILQITHIQISTSLVSSLPMLDLKESDIKSTYY